MSGEGVNPRAIQQEYIQMAVRYSLGRLIPRRELILRTGFLATGGSLVLI